MIDLSGFMPVELTEQLRFILDLGGAIVAALDRRRHRRPAAPAGDRRLHARRASSSGRSRRASSVARSRSRSWPRSASSCCCSRSGVEFSIRELRSVGRIVIPGGVAQVLLVLASGALVMALLGHGPARGVHRRAPACRCRRRSSCSSSSSIAARWTASTAGRPSAGRSSRTSRRSCSSWPAAAGRRRRHRPVRARHGEGGRLPGHRLRRRDAPAAVGVRARSRGSGRASCSCWPSSPRRCMTAFVSSAVFGLSLALGAFVAGVLVSESELSHQAAAEVTPFRDLFAVLFFVSVGMLVDPAALVADAPMVAVLVVVAVVVKGVSIAVLGRALGLPMRSAILLGGDHGPGRRVQLHPGRERPPPRPARRADLQHRPRHGRRDDRAEPVRHQARRPTCQRAGRRVSWPAAGRRHGGRRSPALGGCTGGARPGPSRPSTADEESRRPGDRRAGRRPGRPSGRHAPLRSRASAAWSSIGTPDASRPSKRLGAAHGLRRRRQPGDPQARRAGPGARPGHHHRRPADSPPGRRARTHPEPAAADRVAGPRTSARSPRSRDWASRAWRTRRPRPPSSSRGTPSSAWACPAPELSGIVTGLRRDAYGRDLG